MKRGFESVGSARYRTPFAPPTLLGAPEPAHPRQALPAPNAALLAPSVVPTTTASNKKTNVQIPYTRVVSDARHLPRERGELVFVRKVADATVAGKLRVSANDRTEFLAGLESVNAKVAEADPDDQEEEAEAWSVDGVLISTEREMDPEEAARTSYDEPLASSAAVLIALQGHTVMRNVFSDRAFVGDYCYVGLVHPRGQVARWAPFSSQHLDMAYAPEPPTAPQLGFHGTATRKRTRVAFAEADAAGLCAAYCIGRVVDSAPTPGDVTVNVQVRRMSWAQLGVRHDEEHAKLVPSGTVFRDSKGRVRRKLMYDKWVYPPNQRIGRDCASNDRVLSLLRKWVRQRKRGKKPRVPESVNDFCLLSMDNFSKAPSTGNLGTGVFKLEDVDESVLNLFGPIVMTVCAILTKWRGKGNVPVETRAELAKIVGTDDDVRLADAEKQTLTGAERDRLVANIKTTLPDASDYVEGPPGVFSLRPTLENEDLGAKPGLIDYDADAYDTWDVLNVPEPIPPDSFLERTRAFAAKLDAAGWDAHEVNGRALALLGEAASAVLAGVGGSDMLGSAFAGGVQHPDWIPPYLDQYEYACEEFLGPDAPFDDVPRLADVLADTHDQVGDDVLGSPLRLAACAVEELQGKPNREGRYFEAPEWNEPSTLGVLLRCAMALLLVRATKRVQFVGA